MNQEKRERIENLMTELSSLANGGLGKEEIEFIFEQFCRKHRTIQQNMMRVILGLVIGISSEDYSTDGRNEASKTSAKAMINGLALQVKENYLANCHDREDEYYQKKAEEYYQAALESPEKYIGLPLI